MWAEKDLETLKRCFKMPKSGMTTNLIAFVSTSIAADHHNNIQDLARAHGTLLPPLVASCCSQLGPAKKSTRWVPKLLPKSIWRRKLKILFVGEY